MIAPKENSRIERNIEFNHGKYRVRLRRMNQNVDGGRFADLTDARRARDEMEARLAPSKPWGLTPRNPNPRTVYTLRNERRAAGLCQACGCEPPKPGLLTCQSCIDIAAIKRAARAEFNQR